MQAKAGFFAAVTSTLVSLAQRSATNRTPSDPKVAITARVYALVNKHANGTEPSREPGGRFIHVRLEEVNLVTRCICRAEKFTVVISCAEDGDFHLVTSGFIQRQDALFTS